MLFTGQVRKFLKIFIVTVGILIWNIAGVFSQTHYQSNISIGAKGGVDISRVFFNPSVQQGMLVGATGGVTFRYIEENHFGLIAELLFAQRGWKENFESAPFNYSRTLDYISLPILAHIYFGRRGRFFFNAGPEFSMFLKESTNSNFNPHNISSIPDFPLRYRTVEQLTTDVSQKFDYGISAGLGGEFFINPRNSIYVEGRFYYGLGNIMPSKRRDYFNGSNQMTVSATIGYWFRIK